MSTLQAVYNVAHVKFLGIEYIEESRRCPTVSYICYWRPEWRHSSHIRARLGFYLLFFTVLAVFVAVRTNRFAPFNWARVSISSTNGAFGIELKIIKNEVGFAHNFKKVLRDNPYFRAIRQRTFQDSKVGYFREDWTLRSVVFHLWTWWRIFKVAFSNDLQQLC